MLSGAIHEVYIAHQVNCNIHRPTAKCIEYMFITCANAPAGVGEGVSICSDAMCSESTHVQYHSSAWVCGRLTSILVDAMYSQEALKES